MKEVAGRVLPLPNSPLASNLWREEDPNVIRSNQPIPRPEYPRPFVRESWQNLNGPWEFTFDDQDTGEAEERQTRSDAPFDRTIIVPFAYQSELSGIGSKEVHEIVWYRRAFDAPFGRSDEAAAALRRSRLRRKGMGERPLRRFPRRRPHPLFF